MTRNVALLVIDVQRVYMEPEPMVTSDGDDLIVKCGSLIEKARGAGVPIVFVQHLSDEQPDDPELIAVHPDLAPRPGEPIVQKRFGSAFFQTEMEKTLREFGAKTLHISGLATFGCVDATVMCAICKGYDTVVVKDAHGARDLPDWPVNEVIDHHNAEWERAGARLVRASDVAF